MGRPRRHLARPRHILGIQMKRLPWAASDLFVHGPVVSNRI